jgi:hypothetical protein
MYGLRRFLFRWFPSLLSDEEVWEEYTEIGILFGDLVNSIVMAGECVGFEKYLNKWAFWERAYSARGYRTLAVDIWMMLDWHPDQLSRFKFIRREADEPVFHAERYRERWLGKADVKFIENDDGTGVMIQPDITTLLPANKEVQRSYRYENIARK